MRLRKAFGAVLETAAAVVVWLRGQGFNIQADNEAQEAEAETAIDCKEDFPNSTFSSTLSPVGSFGDAACVPKLFYILTVEGSIQVQLGSNYL